MNTWRHIVGFYLGWERDDQGRYRKGTWSQGYSGSRFWCLDPFIQEIHYDDICIGLAREPRYRGQTRELLPVAEHSVIVSLYCEKLARERGWTQQEILAVAREGLLHDAPEAYLGDISRPLKRTRVMRGYRKLEAKWELVIFEKFGIHPTKKSRALVKEVDNRVVLDEIEALFIDPDMWPRSGRYVGLEPLGAEIAAMKWEHAAEAFSQRFLELYPDYL